MRKILLHGFLVALLLTACEGSSSSSTDRFSVGKNKNQKKETIKEDDIHQGNVEKVLRKYAQENPETIVEITTSMGKIRLKLYEETPLHRANFIRLAKKKFFDEGVFYRVIKGFMIQGGDSDKRKQPIGVYQVPPEMNPRFFHKRGALAMANRNQENRIKSSSSHDFFIVIGQKYYPEELTVLNKNRRAPFTPEQSQTYTQIGGTPDLDYNYTVFGEVISGMDVVEKIAAVETDKGHWPLSDIPMQVRVIE